MMVLSIEIPRVSRLGTAMFQLIGVRLAKFQTPLPNRFRAQHDPTFSHNLFNIGNSRKSGNRARRSN